MSLMRSYRFREFADEAAARTAAGLSTERA
jgi:hypothetical protein